MAGVVSEEKKGTTSLHFNRENYLCCLRKSIWRGIGPCEENGKPFFLLPFVLELSNLMKGPHYLCWNSETSELLYNNCIKNTMDNTIFLQSTRPCFSFFSCHSFCLCVCGLFCQHKGSRICHYTEWQLSELGSLSNWCPRGTEHRRRERLSEVFWSAANAISWCHVLSALLFTSPL